MPELPEVEALRVFLADRAVGLTIADVQLAAFHALKTFELPLSALSGCEVDAVARRGKYLALSAGEMWLAWHLSRGGWLTWRETTPKTMPRKGPLALRVAFAEGPSFDLTEYGTQRRLAVHLVNNLDDVAMIATLGPDPLAADFDPAALNKILDTAGGAQLKGVLRDQRIIAGIGNAYSDEILHAAKLSPFKAAGRLTPDERAALYAGILGELAAAVERASGLQASELKDTKRSAMRVHGRTGLPCPVCGTTVAEVSFADSSLQYCPTCQTGGKLLADRRMSRLLK